MLPVLRQGTAHVLPTVRGVRVVDSDEDQVVLVGLVVQGQRDLHRRRQLAARLDAGDVPLVVRGLVVLERRHDRVLGRFGLECGRYCRATGRDGRAGVVLADDLGGLGRNRYRLGGVACEDTGSVVELVAQQDSHSDHEGHYDCDDAVAPFAHTCIQ